MYHKINTWGLQKVKRCIVSTSSNFWPLLSCGLFCPCLLYIYPLHNRLIEESNNWGRWPKDSCILIKKENSESASWSRRTTKTVNLTWRKICKEKESSLLSWMNQPSHFQPLWLGWFFRSRLGCLGNRGRSHCFSFRLNGRLGGLYLLRDNKMQAFQRHYFFSKVGTRISICTNIAWACQKR